MADYRVLVLPSTGVEQRQKDGDRVIVGDGAGTATGNLTLFAAGGTIVHSDHTSLAAGKNLTASAGAGAVDFSAMTGTFLTPTGANTLSGSTTLAAGKSFTAASGAGAFDFSAATGTFKTSTGAVTIGPGTVTVSGAAIFSASGTGLAVANNALVSGSLTVTGELSADGGVGRSSSGTLALGGDADSTAVSLSRSGVTTTVLGSLTVSQSFTINGNETVTGNLTVNGNTILGDAATDTVSFFASAQASGTASFDFSGASGPFLTSSGANTLSGSVTLVGGKSFTASTGSGAFDFSAATGTFATSTGTNTLSGSTTLAGGKSFTAGSGAGAFDLSAATGLFKTSTGAVTVGGGSSSVTITAGAASVWSTTAGALTLTSAAAATWSTGAGAMTLNGFAGINLQNNGTTQLAIGNGTLTVQTGALLATTGAGNINLPNNASARFQIEGTAVAATVTAANFATLTNGSNADALHTHAGSGSSGAQVKITGATAGETLIAFALVAMDDASGTPKVFNAKADGSGEILDPIGYAAAAATSGSSVDVILFGEITAATTNFVSAPATSDVGKYLFMSTTAGKYTLTAPTTTGQTVKQVGVLTNGSGSPKILPQFGPSIVL